MSNIILCGYPNNFKTDKLIDSLKKRNIFVSTVITSDIDISSSSGVEYISHSTLTDIYRDVSFQEDDSIALSFIANKHSFILRCMSRWDESITNNDDRLFIIDSIFLFFISLLKRKNIQIVFYGTGTPHHFYNLLLSFAAKYLQVSNIFPVNNWINNRVRFVLEDYNTTIPVNGFDNDGGKMLKYLEDLRFTQQVLTPQAQRVYRDKRASNYFTFFFFILFPQILGRIKFILKNDKDLYLKNSNGKTSRIFSYLIHITNSQIFKFRYKKKYFLNSINTGTPSKSIILYGMNQPEATSHPDGGFYPDYRYWVYFLKIFGKPIFYKEHKANFIHHTDKDIVDTYKHRSLYYLDFFISNNVSLISENYSTTKLLANDNEIFTLSGSIILESIIRNKNVYYPGIPFHGDLPGTEIVISNKQVILKKTPILSFHEIVNYFNMLDSFSIPNYEGFATSVKESVDYNTCLNHIDNVLSWVLEYRKQHFK